MKMYHNTSKRLVKRKFLSWPVCAPSQETGSDPENRPCMWPDQTTMEIRDGEILELMVNVEDGRFSRRLINNQHFVGEIHRFD